MRLLGECGQTNNSLKGFVIKFSKFLNGCCCGFFINTSVNQCSGTSSDYFKTGCFSLLCFVTCDCFFSGGKFCFQFFRLSLFIGFHLFLFSHFFLNACEGLFEFCQSSLESLNFFRRFYIVLLCFFFFLLHLLFFVFDHLGLCLQFAHFYL